MKTFVASHPERLGTGCCSNVTAIDFIIDDVLVTRWSLFSFQTPPTPFLIGDHYQSDYPFHAALIIVREWHHDTPLVQLDMNGGNSESCPPPKKKENKRVVMLLVF